MPFGQKPWTPEEEKKLLELAKRQLFYDRQERILETEEFVLLDEILPRKSAYKFLD